MSQESPFLYHDAPYFVMRVDDGVEVYRNAFGHSTRVAGIYFKNHEQNMERAIAEIDRRKAIDISIRCTSFNHQPQAAPEAVQRIAPATFQQASSAFAIQTRWRDGNRIQATPSFRVRARKTLLQRANRRASLEFDQARPLIGEKRWLTEL